MQVLSFFSLSSLSSRPIIQTLKQIHSPPLTWVIKPHLPILHRNLRQLRHTEAHIHTPQILHNKPLVHTLRDHRRPPRHPPPKHRLRRRTILPLPHPNPELILDDRRHLRVLPVVRRIQIRQRRVRDHLDPQTGMPRSEQGLLQVRVRLVFMGVRFDLRVREQVLDVPRREVRDPDVPRQVRGDQLLHSVPRVQHAGVGVQPRGARLEGHGPVHQVQVEVGRAQVGERLFERRAHQMRRVVVVPELGGYPVLGPGEGGGVQGCADVFFVAVGSC